MISRNSATEIVKMVAARYRVPHLTLRSAIRVEPYITCRAEAMYILRQFQMSFPEIGALFNRDHTTVMASCGRVESRFETHADYKAEVGLVLADAQHMIGPDAITATKELPAREPPMLSMLKAGRDEMERSAQLLHRFSLLLDAAIVRLEGREEQPILVNVQRADEEVPQ